MFQVAHRQRRGFIAIHNAHHLGAWHLPRHNLNLGDFLDSINEHQINAGILIHQRAAHSFFRANRRHGIRPANNQRPIRRAGRDGAFQPPDVFFCRDQLDAGQLAAALWRHLVFQMDRSNTCLRIFFNSARDIGRAAIARISIGDDRNAHRPGHIPRLGGHFRLRQQPNIRPPQPRRRGAEACHVNRLKPRLFNKPRGQAIGRAGGGDDAADLEALTQMIRSVHGALRQLNLLFPGRRYQLIPAAARHQMREAREMQMHPRDQQPVGRDHVKHAPTRCFCRLGIGIKRHADFRAGGLHFRHMDNIAPDQQLILAR